MSQMALSWSIGTHWTLEMHLQVPAGLECGQGRECLVRLEEVLFLIVFPFHTQYRLCLPEELLPVATSSVWVRGPKAGHEGARVWGYGLWSGGC